MKTKILLLLTAIVVTQLASAQFNLGVKAGANITKIDGQAFRDEFKYVYHLGGFAEIGLGKKLMLQPEVLFNQYQTRVDSSFSSIYEHALDVSNYRDVKLNYLSIPLILNYRLGNVLSLQAGPQFGILLDQEKNLLENGESAFSEGDFSMVGGAQINISKLRLSGRYVVGLNNISDIDDSDKWKNQGFQLSLGLSF